MRVLAISLIALAFGFFGSMPLAGPIAVLTVSRAANGRLGEALRIGLGAAVAEGIYAGVALWGFATFLSRYKLIVPLSHGATAIILTALGIRFLFWRMTEPKDARENHAGTLLLGFSVSILNPTLLLTWSAAVAFLFSKNLAPPSGLAAIPFGACAAAGIGGWFTCLVGLMRKYRGKIPGRALTYGVRAMGLTLVALGLWAGVALTRWARDPSERAKSPGVSLLLPAVRRPEVAPPMPGRLPTRHAAVSLIVDGAHYEHVTLALASARTSVWIATANVKQLLVQAPAGTSARARGRYVPIVDTFQTLVGRGVSIRLLHAATPSRLFARELAARRRLLLPPRFEMRVCPRVHLKMIAIDGASLYLGSANLTGAGLGAKGDGRRNFEMGLLTEDDFMLDAAQARFDRIWRGASCAGCRLRSVCPGPLDKL
jgi:threonine/homoserine/homoserine lactone efflux protein